jgi:exopolysaccharide biosynthesis polyprenyl glycosylphosphotransferase
MSQHAATPDEVGIDDLFLPSLVPSERNCPEPVLAPSPEAAPVLVPSPRDHSEAMPGTAVVRKSCARQGSISRLRGYAGAADVCIALVAVAAALATSEAEIALLAVVWAPLSIASDMRFARTGVLFEARPYLRANVGLVLVATALAVVGGDIDAIRIALGITSGLVVCGLITRSALVFAARRGWLGLTTAESILVVGSLESVSRTVAEWESTDRVEVVGVCLSETGPRPEAVKGVPVLGGVSDTDAVAHDLGVDVVAVHDVDLLGGYQIAKLEWALEDIGTRLTVITPVTNTVSERAHVRALGRRLVVDVACNRPSGTVGWVKGALDRLLGFAGLIVAVPVIGVCMVLIKLDSAGPAIFKQTRVRERGRTFTMYKLRTMTSGSEAHQEDLLPYNEVGGGMFKMRVDPRVTGVGAWLRRLSLDELPQLWNVVRGDMSLIGPRPAEPFEVASYDDIAMRRLAVKPGLTGLWQVSGRSNLSWDETVRIDQYYVDNWCPRREVAIALRTVKAVLKKDGAY